MPPLSAVLCRRAVCETYMFRSAQRAYKRQNLRDTVYQTQEKKSCLFSGIGIQLSVKSRESKFRPTRCDKEICISVVIVVLLMLRFHQYLRKKKEGTDNVTSLCYL